MIGHAVWLYFRFPLGLRMAPIGALIEEIRFADDSPLEGTGFEPSVPLLRKAHLGVANRRRRHEGRSHLQVQARDGNACLEWAARSLSLRGGTASSNPSPSSGESRANQTWSLADDPRRRPSPVASAIECSTPSAGRRTGGYRDVRPCRLAFDDN
jgi:hypothetical protein